MGNRDGSASAVASPGSGATGGAGGGMAVGSMGESEASGIGLQNGRNLLILGSYEHTKMENFLGVRGSCFGGFALDRLYE